MTWPTVRIGEVLRLDLEKVPLDPSKTYPMVGVLSFGRGLFEREPVHGGGTSYRHFFRLRARHFVMSQLFGWEGALALSEPRFEKAFLSPQFPTFSFDESRLDREFFGWYVRRKQFWGSLGARAVGMGDRRRTLTPEALLGLEMPLPPLAEQRRITTTIEELRVRIEEAKGLRSHAEEEGRHVMAAEERRIWPREDLLGAAALSDVTTHLARGRQSRQGDSSHVLIKTQHVQQGRYLESTLRLAAEVAFKVPAKARVHQGDVLIACSAAGCLGRVARFNQADVIASTDTHVAIARADPVRVLPEYLYAYLRGAQGQLQLRSREKGDWTREKVGFRLTELNVADLRRVPVPVPPIPEQRRIVAYLGDLQAKVATLTTLQEKTAAELDALLPSILDKAFKGEL